MSTSGLFGFRKNGVDKAFYHHFDSYPEGLGKDFLYFVLTNRVVTVPTNRLKKIDSLFDNLIEINPDITPTKKQQKYCIDKGWCNTSVSDQSETDWYCLLRNLQSLNVLQKEIGKDNPIYFDNYIGFIKSPTFCEYAYILDLDSETIEVYIGYPEDSNESNRYAMMDDDCEPPCKLVVTYKVKDLFCEDEAINIIVEDMREKIEKARRRRKPL